MTNKVGERYQITIDKAVREKLGVQPGDQAMEWAEDGRLIVEFMPRPHNRSLRGILKRPEVPAGSTDSGAEKEAAWIARSIEITDSLAADTARHRKRPRTAAG